MEPVVQGVQECGSHSRQQRFDRACHIPVVLAPTVPHFTQLVCSFIILVAPPCTGRPPPGGVGWAQTLPMVTLHLGKTWTFANRQPYIAITYERSKNISKLLTDPVWATNSIFFCMIHYPVTEIQNTFVA